MKFDLGVLDLCKVRRGARDPEIIWETIELAPQLESYGYSRFWLAEHHNESIAHSSPELLIPVLAGVTQRMRIGVAGVLLQYQNPFRVAKNFRLLQVVFPSRIDLGLARGGVPDTVGRLLGNCQEKPYEEKVEELLSFLRGHGEIAANPIGVKPPAVWILGSKEISAGLAGQHGTNFCFAQFLSAGGDDACLNAIRTYQQSFRPSPELSAPRWCVAVAGVCATTDQRARELLGSSIIELDHSRVGTMIPTVVGDPAHCRSAFLRMAEMFGTRQFVFSDMCPTADLRGESYRLISETLELNSAVKSLAVGN